MKKEMMQLSVFVNGNGRVTIEQDIDPNLSTPDVQRIEVDPSQVEILKIWLEQCALECIDNA